MMKRQFVAGVLSLAVAGCAQSRSALTKEDSSRKPDPVAITPVPSIYDSINRGNGGEALAKSAMKDPKDSFWTGRAPVSVAMGGEQVGGSNAGQGSGPGAGPGPGAAPVTSPGAASPTSIAAQGPVPSADSSSAGPPAVAATTSPSPAVTAPQPPSVPVQAAGSAVIASETAAHASAAPASTALPSSDPAPVAAPVESQPASSKPEASGVTISELPPLPALPPRSAATEERANGATSMPPESGGAEAKSPAAPPADPAISPSATGMPPAPETDAPREAPKRDRDPLLGPNPDIMPPILDTPPPKQTTSSSSTPAKASELVAPQGPASAAPGSAKEPEPAPPKQSDRSEPAQAPASAPRPVSSKPSASPAGTPVKAPEATPKRSPATAAPAGGALELEAAPTSGSAQVPGGAGKASAAGAGTDSGPAASAPPGPAPGSSSVAESARADKLAAELPLEQAPFSRPAQPGPVVRRVAARPAAPLRDDEIVLASHKVPAKTTSTEKHDWKQAGRAVARVGDEIITFHDLVVATREILQKYPELRLQPNFDGAEQLEKRKQIDMIARQTLNRLVERSLLAQEAKRQIKDPKQLDRALEAADKWWTDEELAPLMRAYHVDTQQQLKERLAEQGRSLDSIRKSFRQDFLAESFMHEKLKDKLNVDLPDLLKYYGEHVQKHDFDRPAQTTWRELVVEAHKYPSREDARRKANALLEQLRRGEDFAQLALTRSDGPASTRKQGGLMRTTPGGYAVAEVNSALETLPLGRTSGVIEGPDSFHIVRVEERRPAGPASFQEVQEQIMPILVQQKRLKERAAFIAKLRQRTIITTIFDGTDSDPNKLAQAK